MTPSIDTPDSPALDALCADLVAMAGHDAWPAEQLRRCGEAGVFRWFVGPEHGGLGWSEADLVRGYRKLAAACLTTAFVITQRVGAMTRIAACKNVDLQQRLLPALVAGRSFATLGISHLTTSRRHLKTPALRFTEDNGGLILDGLSPWVTGAEHADHVVLGAEAEDGRQVLLALPTNLTGVRVPPAPDLVALTASRTGELHCERVRVGAEQLLAGPMPEVMKYGLAAKTGGLQTSALALGLATAAVDYLAREAANRPDLVPPQESLRDEVIALAADMLAVADGRPVCSGDELRGRANSLVLRATQAALAAAKGAGFVAAHPVGRWCREALFFLVWSCPPGVLNANLCELAGLGD